MIFAVVASVPQRKDRGKTLVYLLQFFAAGWLPLAVYLLLFHFGWSWWYYMPETTEHRGILTVVPLVIELFLTVGGYSLTVWLLDAGKKNAAFGAIALTGGLELALLIVPYDRYGMVGDWSMYHAHMATPLLQSWGFLGELAVGFTWLGAVLGWTLWKTSKLPAVDAKA